jgi:hypothetical protein
VPLVNAVTSLSTSALVAALAGAGAGYLSQRAMAGRNARLTYEFAARKRLYEALGPLRFQLVLAAKDLLRRVGHHQRSEWNLNPAEYYAHSFIYRLLRPLAVCLLIEREMNYADFSVDKEAISLLRFQAAAYRMLAHGDPLPFYEGLDWATESQHVFRDNLRIAAQRLLEKNPDGRLVVIDYGRFLEVCPDPLQDPATRALARLFRPTPGNLAMSPVFWTRLVGYAHVCQHLVATQGKAAGFAATPLDTRAMLAAVKDGQIQAHLGDYPAISDGVVAEDL